jgi:hypothetical protein
MLNIDAALYIIGKGWQDHAGYMHTREMTSLKFMPFSIRIVSTNGPPKGTPLTYVILRLTGLSGVVDRRRLKEQQR